MPLLWYAELFQEVQYENHHYAFIRTPGCLIGFHPQDSKVSGWSRRGDSLLGGG
jgi:hypothetical protein